MPASIWGEQNHIYLAAPAAVWKHIELIKSKLWLSLGAHEQT